MNAVSTTAIIMTTIVNVSYVSACGRHGFPSREFGGLPDKRMGLELSRRACPSPGPGSGPGPNSWRELLARGEGEGHKY